MDRPVWAYRRTWAFVFFLAVIILAGVLFYGRDIGNREELKGSDSAVTGVAPGGTVSH